MKYRGNRDSVDRDDPLRPSMGRRRAPEHERAPTFRAQVRRALQRQGGIRFHSGHAMARRGLVAVRAPHAFSRRCVIKGRYVSMTPYGQKAAKLHLAYLERDGVERDGAPGRLYGADETFTAEAFSAPLPGEQRQFRFIVSPEDGDRLDLTDFARRFMSEVEKDTGRRLVWAAVNHHNTDNPHVHIVIRGLDRDGDDLRIDGRYIGREMRWRAQEILTRELGRRSELDIARERSAEIDRERPTTIDRMLTGHLSRDGVVTLGQLAEAPQPERAACLARLDSLKRMGLARTETAGTWRLARDWEADLARRATRADALERLRRLVPGLGGERYRVLDPGSPFDGFQGVVKGKGLHDELEGTMFIAVETQGRVAYYVPVTPEVAESVRQGDNVRVGSHAEGWVKPTDRILARAAQETGGVYDPVHHQRALEAMRQRQPPVDPGTPSPADLVSANLRRLERLERYNLVSRLPDGRWRVAPDLVAQLEAREHSHPQHRLRVEAVGIDPGARDRGHASEATERTALGARLAKQLGLTFVESPQRFKGRMFACEPTVSGREHVRVVDLASGRFTLVPKPPDALRLEGRMVSVAIDRQRGLSIEIDRGLSR
jgi:type IV secretory pathway VirD2 relaxase